MRSFLRGLKKFLASDKFFYLVLGFFIFQAIWIALSGLYPMAFDERMHHGLIRLYSGRLLPFWSEQPAGADLYGAVVRDPSYLYHYLMSFPYRFIKLFISTETSQILFLRFTSIIFVAAGIILYRRVLGYSKAGKALINSLMAIFILTPVVPFLAAQVNYDSLAFLVTAAAVLLALQISTRLQKGQVNLTKIGVFLSLIMLGSLIKYAFLPVAFTTFCFVAYHIYKQASGRAEPPLLFPKAPSSGEPLGLAHGGRLAFGHRLLEKARVVRLTKAVIVLLVLLSFGLFFERYGINTIRYKTPTPECDQVLSIEKCMEYPPWRRNYLTRQDKIAGGLNEVYPTSITWYVYHRWVPWITDSMFEVFNGEASGYVIGRSMPVSVLFYQAFAAIGGLLILWHNKYLREKQNLGFFMALILFLALPLFVQNYADFLRIGYPYAIQGRYLLPVLPLIYLIPALAISRSLNKLPNTKTALTVGAILILLTQSSGIVTYIMRSDGSWYWQNSTVNEVNGSARKIIKPLVFPSFR